MKESAHSWLAAGLPHLQALGLLFGGLLLGKLLAMAIRKFVSGKWSKQQEMMASRACFYLVALISIATALRHVGVDLSVFLGAAGIVTVAVGFASQTSASNIISGLMLMGERPFVVGDTIRVGSTIGEVVTVDLLSVKLRTFDNLLERIPNEMLLKSTITNLTHFPIRRVDVMIGVAYHEDLDRVRKILTELADAHPLSLDEPRPAFVFNEFGDSALNCRFSIWCARVNFLELRTSLQIQIKAAFDEAGIEIPFPHRTLYAGSRTEPLPIRIVSPD